MTPNLGKSTFDDAELTQLRGEATAFIEREAITKKAFAMECDVPEGTFGPWLAGNYAGDNEKVAAKVYRFLTARKEQAQLAASVPVAPSYQDTPTSKRIFAALDHAQVFNDLVVIGLGPGLGKTATITQYRAVRPRVFVASMKPSTRGLPNAMIAILEAMGDREAKGTPQALSRRIAARATEGAVLIIDEAQHLSQQAVDELRSIHDETRCGLVFSGDESVFSLFDGTRKAAFAQFHSRIGLRIRQARPLVGDATTIAAAHGITDAALVKLVVEMANKPGALRGVTKTLLVAKRFAAMNDEALSPQLIRDVWQQRTDVAA